MTVLESDDGLRFRRTGVKISAGGFTTIFLDPHDPDPARRYKLFHLEFSPPFDPARHGVFASYSADGVHFTKVGRVLPFFTDNPPLVHWDQRLGKYVIYTRAFCYESENQRRIGRIETADPLLPWPYRKTDKDRMFLSIDNVPVVLDADAQDDPHSDIYYNDSTIYPWAQDVYLMFTTQFRHFSPNRNPFIRPRVPGQWEDFGMLEVQLAVSRDGIRWTRPCREPYFPTGLADEWDRWYAVMGPGIARRGNYLYQYYNSSGRLHDWWSCEPSTTNRPNRSAELELSGSGSTASYRPTPITRAAGWKRRSSCFAARDLRLNIDTGAMGTAFVELQDADGRPIPGFALADCEEIGGNFIDQSVYWKGSADVSSLAGRPLRMRINLKRAKLYSFQFAPE